MALMAYGVGPGDAIFTTPFTFVATGEVISLLGATPVFVDIDPKTYNIDPQKLVAAIAAVDRQQLTPKAVIPVDLFGLPADYDAINAIVDTYNQRLKTSDQKPILVLEDAAQGFGGRYKGRMAGSLAAVAATSFFPAKPLGCYGDGGAIFTDDAGVAETLRSIRVHGKGSDKYDNVRIGVNGRLDTIQAAILLEKLKIFPDEIEARQQIAETYTELFTALSDQQNNGCNQKPKTKNQKPGFLPPSIPDGYQSAWAQYSILCDQRDELQSRLKDRGIPTAVYYPTPLHLQTAYSSLGYAIGDFPVSESVASRILSFPMGPYLSHEDTIEICNAVIAILNADR